MTPLDVFESVFTPSTLVVTTFLGLAFGAFFWATMPRVLWSRVLIVYLPALVFMVTTAVGRYIDGSALWPAWLAAATLWSWSIAVAMAGVAIRRRLGI